jgi:[acyl-carrier-protein] S-malonyltransferase
LAQAVPLVRLRAQAMQEAVPVGTGAMAAVLGLPSDKVNAICQEAQDSFGAGSAEVVQAANFNDPGQTVISGSKAAVEKACELLKAAGAKRTLPLPVSAPFHCALMKPAAERLRVALADVAFQPPSIPLINNIDGASPSGADDIRDALYRQAFGPVRWVEVIQTMQQRGVGLVVECGPGKVLAGMTPRIDANLQVAPLFDPTTLAQVQALLATQP